MFLICVMTIWAPPNATWTCRHGMTVYAEKATCTRALDRWREEIKAIAAKPAYELSDGWICVPAETFNFPQS
jgi:predicted metal-binding protein